VHLSLYPGAAHNSHHFFYSPCALSRNLGYGIGNRFLARKALVGGDIRIVDNFFCVCFTPGEAAPTSLGPGKRMQYRFHLGIGLNMEFLGGYGKPDSENKPDASQRGHAT
jgi:hypothetical protein